MGVNLNNTELKWANKAKGFYASLNTSDSIFWRMNAIFGKQGKVSLAVIDLKSSLLSPIKCDLSNVSELDGRPVEFEIKNYELKIPIRGCDIAGTWLETELKKGKNNDETEYFIDDLLPIIAKRTKRDIYDIILKDVINYAKADGNVNKVASLAITDANSAHDAIVDFISKLNPEILNEVNSDESYSNYTIFVSPEVKKLLRDYYDGTNGNASYIQGFEIYGSSQMAGNQFMCTSFDNMVYAPDLNTSSDYFKIVKKEEIDTSFILGGIAIGSTFIEHEKIVLTDNI